jgi:CubicO group peptidase (beta-lactamase class C family)
MDEIFPHCKIPAGPSSLPLPRAAHEPRITYQRNDAGALRELSLDDYLRAQPVTGLLILKDGENLVERYQLGRTANHRFVSHSMAKSIMAMAIGAAVGQGKIASVDDPAARYVPALAGSAYGETSIRNLLRMSAGIKFEEVYNGRDDLALWDTIHRRDGAVKAALAFNQREAEPGHEFSYSSANTVVLALVLRAAVGMTTCDWVSRTLWQPMGAEAMASWVVESDGVEKAYGYFNATLRDYARLGWLLANQGRLGDHQIIPAEFVLDATRADRQPDAFQPGKARHLGAAYFGYGYQTWIFPGPRPMFALLGVFGQAILVDPTAKLVLVQTAATMGPADFEPVLRLWAGVVQRLAGPT